MNHPEHDSQVWNALLGVSSFHGNIELGRKAACVHCFQVYTVQLGNGDWLRKSGTL